MKMSRTIFIVFISLAAVFTLRYWSDNNRITEQVKKKITRRMEEGMLDSMSITRTLECMHMPSFVQQLYSKNKNYPLWLNDNGLLPQADSLYNLLKKCDEDGLTADSYHFSFIQNTLATLNKNAFNTMHAQQLADIDLIFTDAWLSYSTDLALGSVHDSAYNVYRSNRLSAMALPDELYTAQQSNYLSLLALRLRPSNKMYLELRRKLAIYRAIQAKGGWEYFPDYYCLKPGEQSAMIPVLREHLASLDNTHTASDLSSMVYDRKLEREMKRFQANNGLEATGMVNAATAKVLNVSVDERIMQIALNMERLRWLPTEWAADRIVVNIADFSMKLYQHDTLCFHTRAIVGQPYRQTPVFSASLTYMVLNPYWEIPARIAKEEILPAQKKDAAYLDKHHIRVYSVHDNEGIALDPDSIDWKHLKPENFHYYLRQEPGPWNALGRIKFMFPNKFNVYMHDTPEQALFTKTIRTFSHGCIRIENPMQLAHLLLPDDSLWTSSRINDIIEQEMTLIVSLPRKVPVYITYMTSWVDEEGHLQFRKDVYGQDKIMRTLIEDERNSCRSPFIMASW